MAKLCFAEYISNASLHANLGRVIIAAHLQKECNLAVTLK